MWRVLFLSMMFLSASNLRASGGSSLPFLNLNTEVEGSDCSGVERVLAQQIGGKGIAALITEVPEALWPHTESKNKLSARPKASPQVSYKEFESSRDSVLLTEPSARRNAYDEWIVENLGSFEVTFQERIQRSMHAITSAEAERAATKSNRLTFGSQVQGEGIVRFIIWNMSRLPGDEGELYFHTLTWLIESQAVSKILGKKFVQTVLTQGLLDLGLRYYMPPKQALERIMAAGQDYPTLASVVFEEVLEPNLLRNGALDPFILKLVVDGIAQLKHPLRYKCSELLGSIIKKDRRFLHDPMVDLLANKNPAFDNWLTGYMTN